MTDRSLPTPESLRTLDFDKQDGLLPVVVQDAATGQVLMVAWANHEALERSLESGEAHFWSRSRDELWRKGATSGNTLALVALHADCDGDTVLARVHPTGPACHTGETTCFGEATEAGVLHRLDGVLRSRAEDGAESSYTVKLLSDENLRLKKLGEETAELVAALAKHDAARATEEAADLVYHVLAALRAEGLGLDALTAVLESRAG